MCFLGTPLFPGEDEQDQVACIMEVLGLPCSSVMRKIRRLHHFFTDSGEPRYLAERAEQHQTKINGNNRPRRMCRADPGALSLEVLLKSSLGDDGCDPMLTDFIARCIRWDPMKRLTALEGLQHPWVTNGDVSDHDKIKESPQPGGTQPSEGSAISSSLEE
uniref:Protein kinase domain-containing protein n=1 Tax=Mesocestoides corti TaxID=53468 RepID=A0A5K3F3D9_MESCO